MPVINLNAFAGLKPITDPLLIGQSDATIAKNVRLVSGALAPLKGTTTLKALTKVAPQTIFRYGTSANENEYWLEFAADTDVIRSPIAADQYGRVYWTDGGTPKYAPNNLILSGADYPGGSYNLGIPAPTTALTIATFTPPPNASQTETRTYVYTYVSAYGEEGPPSPASALASLDPAQAAGLTGITVAPGGAYNITTKRIYRSSTVGSAAQFQFVAEIPVATTTYSDTVTQANLGEVLPTTEWYPPPTGLKGLKILANGAAIAFKGNTVHLSEPNLPHAWPHEYPIEDQIVGIGVFRQSAVVLTNGRPYLMSGADPQAMSLERMELPQACLSKRSIVDTGDGVLYASPDGVVSISSGGMDVITKSLFTREQWQAYNPSSMQAAVHDNRYHVMYTTAGGVRGTLIFDFSGQGALLTNSDINEASAVTALYADFRTDTLYMAQGSSIVRYNAGTPLTYVWRSKTFRAPYAMNFSRSQLISTAYPTTLKVYADGVLKFTKSVANAGTFFLPSGYRAVDWQFEISGTGEVTQLIVGTAADEFRKT
jgi:hypothetical protein